MSQTSIGQAEWPKVKTGDAAFRWVGFLTVLICFGGFGWWSATAPLERAAFAQGTVKVASNRKTVQHLEGGQVQEIHVIDGQQVQKGDLLIELDASQYQAQLEILTHQLLQVSVIEQRLLAEESGDKQLAKANLANFAADPRLAELVLGQENLLRARDMAVVSRVDVLQQRMEQLQSRRVGLQKKNQTTESLLVSFEKELIDQQELLEQGYAQIGKVRDLQRQISSLQGDLIQTNNELNNLKLQRSETELQVTQIYKDRDAELLQQLTTTTIEKSELEEKIAVTQKKIEQTAITSPVAGYVLGMNLHTIGGVVTPGKPILDIVPQQDRLIVEAQISINDIDSIKVGSIAGMRFSVFNQVKSTVIDGRVEYMSADRLVSEVNGAPYYKAHIAVTPQGMIDLGDHTLIPGMPAEVLINTGTRTLLQYMLRPALDAYSRSLIEE